MPAPIDTEIAEHARQEAPKECCGLVVREPAGLRVLRCKNVSPDPLRFFEIPTDVTLEAIRARTLVGYYHSHVMESAEPSPADIQVAEESGLPCWIYSLRDGVLGVYAPAGAPVPLEGREFVPLVHDCVSLVWDYVKREKGVALPFFPRTAADYWRGTSIDWRPWMKEAGAHLVTVPAVGDILVMSLHGSAKPNHLGIYLGDNQFLHQAAEHPSGREVWHGAWRRATQFIIRVPSR